MLLLSILGLVLPAIVIYKMLYRKPLITTSKNNQPWNITKNRYQPSSGIIYAPYIPMQQTPLPIPNVNQVWPTLTATQIVGVQPMTAPVSSSLFHIQPIYTSSSVMSRYKNRTVNPNYYNKITISGSK